MMKRWVAALLITFVACSAATLVLVGRWAWNHHRGSRHVQIVEETAAPSQPRPSTEVSLEQPASAPTPPSRQPRVPPDLVGDSSPFTAVP
ncbi:MAG: hypothetical protein ACE5LU_30310, partial [Anaerolineae bacterium]